MIVEQFYDKGLAHASYVIISGKEAALVDPARDPKPYYDFIEKHKAEIKMVFETHPHADFVSSHLEIAETTGADIYVSRLLGADYAHKPLDEGDTVTLGEVNFRIIHTPGHSPDSITLLLLDKEGKQHGVFTGDTLFIGDVGRPDLREKAGSIHAKREELAKDMYVSTRQKLMTLDTDAMVYPAHGAGSLCGKNLSSDLTSTIGRELEQNTALQPMDEDTFVKMLLEDQPFIPKYFVYNVALNKAGAPAYEKSIKAVNRPEGDVNIEEGNVIIDARDEKDFKKGHLKGSINLMNGGKFETWLGSVVGPDEKYYLIAKDEKSREELIEKAAKIGYELNIKAAILPQSKMDIQTADLSIEDFDKNPNSYTIVDVRNVPEGKEAKFSNRVLIPLHELRERYDEIPTGKPVVVHCAAGYRSAAGSSILESVLNDSVYDLGERINNY